MINDEVVKCIIGGENLMQPGTYKFENSLELVNYIYTQFKKVENSEAGLNYLLSAVSKAINKNSSLPILFKLKEKGIENTKDTIILCFAMINNMMGDDSFDIKDISELLSENELEHIGRIRSFSSSNHLIIRQSLLELERPNVDFDFKLSESLIKIMYDTEIVETDYTPKCSS